MAIDHIIGYDCIPKQTFGTEGILERIKGRDRAQTIIRLFREAGDARPPSEMGFEYIRNTPEGEEIREVIIVQYLLDEAEALREVEHHCQGCPANRTGQPFGCMGFMQYPISAKGEAWLLNRLPVPDEPLVWLLLKQGISEFGYDGKDIQHLRETVDEEGSRIYFEAETAGKRRLGEVQINGDQLFEMFLSVGNIIPNHAGILLLFLHAIGRDLEAKAIMNITSADADADKHPFLLEPEAGDDRTIADLKDFLKALHIAWSLRVNLLVDA